MLGHVVPALLKGISDYGLRPAQSALLFKPKVKFIPIQSKIYFNEADVDSAIIEAM
jgi:hypothetical protein